MSMLANASPRVRETIERLRAGRARALEKGKEMTAVAVHTLEVTGTAAAIGYYEEKHPGDDLVLGTPVETVIGAVAHVAALTGVARGHEHHLRAVGDGAFAVAGYKWGKRHGALAGTTP